MKLTTCTLASMLLVLLSIRGPGLAQADDETDDTSVLIQAPIDAVSCATAPQTITVLGTSVDITNAQFDGGSATDCSTLEVGRTAELGLGSDAVPLAAVTISDSGTSGASLQGPIQAVDAVAQTIEVLGLTIGTAGAELDGADDDSSDGVTTPIDLSSLIVGQIVSIELDASQLPALVAQKLEMKNFTNQIEVEIDDSTGAPIDDADDDITIDATAKTVVTSPTGTMTTRKTVRLHASSNGNFTLTGVPTGRVRITATRTANGTTHKKTGHAAAVGNTAVPVVLHIKTN